MAAHTRAPVAYGRLVGIVAVGHYVDWRGIDPAASPICQKVGLQPVRQIEDDLVPRCVESKRVAKNILIVEIAAEIKALPVSPVLRDVPLEDPIVSRNAALPYAGSRDILLFGKVARGVYGQ